MFKIFELLVLDFGFDILIFKFVCNLEFSV